MACGRMPDFDQSQEPEVLCLPSDEAARAMGFIDGDDYLRSEERQRYESDGVYLCRWSYWTEYTYTLCIFTSDSVEVELDDTRRAYAEVKPTPLRIRVRGYF